MTFAKFLRRPLLLLPCLFLLQGCLTTAVVTGAAVATKVATDPRTAGRQLDDETLEERIAYNLNADGEIREEGRINVVAYSGYVLLIGQIPHESGRQAAENIARGVEGAQMVYNEIRLGNPISVAQIAKDSLITSQIKSKLLFNSEVKATDVKVITENGEVFLFGNLTHHQIDAAANVAKNVAGVTNVVKSGKLVQ